MEEQFRWDIDGSDEAGGTTTTSSPDVSESPWDDSSSTTSGNQSPFGALADEFGAFDSPGSDFDGSYLAPPVGTGDDDGEEDGAGGATAGFSMEPLVVMPRHVDMRREPARAQPQRERPARPQRDSKKRRQTTEEAGFDGSVLPTLPPQGALLPAGPVHELPNTLVYQLLRDATQVAQGPRPAFLRPADSGGVFIEREAGLFRNLKPKMDRPKGAERWKQSSVLYVQQLEGVSFGDGGRGEVWIKKMYGSVLPAGRLFHA
jgi:hypothetical protein